MTGGLLFNREVKRSVSYAPAAKRNVMDHADLLAYDMNMQPDDILEFTRRRPFVAFRMHVSDGRVYVIRHPDQVMPLWNRVVVGVGDRNGIPSHTEHIALNHVVRLEEADVDASTQAAASN